MNAQPEDDPPELSRCSPAAHRVFDALKDHGDCSRQALEHHTRHKSSTVRRALGELRDHDLVERRALFPTPKYALTV